MTAALQVANSYPNSNTTNSGNSLHFNIWVVSVAFIVQSNFLSVLKVASDSPILCQLPSVLMLSIVCLAGRVFHASLQDKIRQD